MSRYNHNPYKVHPPSKDHRALPELDIALHPNSANFADDISDKKQFNERFIESRISDRGGDEGLYVFMALHNFILFTILSIFFTMEEPSLLELPWVLYPVYAMAVCCVCFVGAMVQSEPIRFNRQAQLVHFRWGRERCLSLPWRQINAFSVAGKKGAFSYYVLHLHFLKPKNIAVEDDGDFKTIAISGMFDDADTSFWMYPNMLRYEFIRRYMEVGLDGIQPDNVFWEENEIRKPTGSAVGIMPRLLPFLARTNIVNKIWFSFWHLLVFGPLIDLWVKRKINRFQWPEDIERLCAEGADLSAFDTTPVKARSDRYYRYAYSDYQYVNRSGKLHS